MAIKREGVRVCGIAAALCLAAAFLAGCGSDNNFRPTVPLTVLDLQVGTGVNLAPPPSGVIVSGVVPSPNSNLTLAVSGITIVGHPGAVIATQGATVQYTVTTSLNGAAQPVTFLLVSIPGVPGYLKIDVHTIPSNVYTIQFQVPDNAPSGTVQLIVQGEFDQVGGTLYSNQAPVEFQVGQTGSTAVPYP